MHKSALPVYRRDVEGQRPEVDQTPIDNTERYYETTRYGDLSVTRTIGQGALYPAHLERRAAQFDRRTTADLPTLRAPLVPPGLGPEAELQPLRWTPTWRWLADHPLRAAGKRTFDLLAGSLLTILLSPLLLVIALAVKVTSPGPILFRHERIARGGGTFGVWKFRTMVCHADEFLREVLESDPALAEAFERDHKLKDDPRVTSIGAVLRRLSLDELPQLFNVIRGDMSLVGPRPIVADEVDRYGEYVDAVLRLRPGMTGIWQISGRNDLPYWRRVQLDAVYASEHTLLSDLVILLCTARVVFGGRGTGAY